MSTTTPNHEFKAYGSARMRWVEKGEPGKVRDANDYLPRNRQPEGYYCDDFCDETAVPAVYTVEAPRADVILYLSDARGVYIPRDFAEQTKRECVSGTAWGEPIADALDQLALGPDACEGYWDLWEMVCNNAVITSPDTGKQYTIYQDGDCWLIEKGAQWDDNEGLDSAHMGANQYYAAVRDPCNDDCAIVDFEYCFDDVEEAARAAHGLAERYAEAEHEFQAKENARVEAQESIPEDLRYVRRAHTAAIKIDNTAGARMRAEYRERAKDYIERIRELNDQYNGFLGSLAMMRKLLCFLGAHRWVMEYLGSPKGRGRASGATHYAIYCRHCRRIKSVECVP